MKISKLILSALIGLIFVFGFITLAINLFIFIDYLWLDIIFLVVLLVIWVLISRYFYRILARNN